MTLAEFRSSLSKDFDGEKVRVCSEFEDGLEARKNCIAIEVPNKKHFKNFYETLMRMLPSFMPFLCMERV